MNKITQLLPNERITRIRNLAWLLAGIFQSKSVHLSKVASKIPGKAMLAQRAGQEYRLIVDGSKVGFGHQLLVITLAYRHRTIPLVWMWVRSSRGHSTSE